jgi:predicted O-linked N-acetylglucosamine transferase (SPINDLY family)
MDQRLAEAQAALNGGRRDEAIEHLKAVVDADPAQPLQVYRVLTIQLYQAGRFVEGEAYTALGVQHHPRDFDLWNVRGVIFRNLKRYPEALVALEQAQKINPKNTSAQSNRGNVLLDMGDAARAEPVFGKLARLEPRNAEHQRQLGRALLKLDRPDAAFVRLRSAVALKKDYIDAWLDMLGSLNDQHREGEAFEVLEKALAANPDHPRLHDAHAILLRRSGQLRAAEAYLLELLPRFPDAAWLHYHLGTTISDWDRDRGNVHMRRAVELEPNKLDYMMALIESLERTRSGVEGENIEEAHQLAVQALAFKAEFTPSHAKIINEVLARVCDYPHMEEVGEFKALGRMWAETDRHTALLKQLPRIQNDADRLELLEQHRIWGRQAERQAAARPIVRPAPGPPGGKIRLGFMSSDLRGHPVGYFALPLFDHLDDRFEVFVYSFYQGDEDNLQKYITERVTAYRWWPDITAREAAQRIADDRLDLLIELGGSTHMNKLAVMAYKPAVRQASWLGYPHSAGLETIDYIVVDPYVTPERADLMLEEPMVMPSTWLALGNLAFPAHPIEPGAPFERRGFITFGTANNSYKYTPQMFQAWAKIVAAVPDSRFVFVRPEGTSPTFRNNVARYFTDAGVSRSRIEWIAVRGSHMSHYNKMDIALDAFPQTGGTTTCEALWMGVPTVTLVGKAFYERLSYSALTNAGLGDLCLRTVDDYVARAIALAHERTRLVELRATLRDRVKASPLGQTEAFARDFYQMVAQTLQGQTPRAAGSRS